jgi:2-polyprenyl-3-methyl-5-hydroxy-6-metoxy-1,4-benzoquinol methylase
MKREIINKIAEETILSIKKIDFSKLDISIYNKNYINSLLPHIDYYFKIYAEVLINLQIKDIASDYIVDFGGGHGFMSLFLKKIGMNVIYCDHNPLSVNTINLIKDETGCGPDIILEGSSAKLLSFCKTDNILPKYLIATDLIEHVYDLNTFFFFFYKLNPNLSMVFTTGSVKSNVLKSIKLRKIMVKEEKNDYFPMRKQFLSEKYPEITYSEIEKIAKLTRGLIFPDMLQYMDIYIKTKKAPLIDIDKYNTCDPETGNWTERILSKKQYRQIINNNHFQVTFKKGFYNINKSNFILSIMSKIINFLIQYFKFSMLALFLIITVKNN